ncbi:MAG: hypothetical protein JNL39_12460 [Opitutaceae bacterium]|nr:hypothetical protein [Opitutaceae bacterium]
MRPPLRLAAVALLAAISWKSPAAPAAADLWSRDNLAAWCIVPYDAAKRGPEARADMLAGLGLRKFAYDWRAAHVPTFDAEVAAMKARRIEIVAWWFPQKLDASARTILDVIARHGIRPQLWVTGGGAPTKDAAQQEARIKAEVERLQPIVAAAANLGCRVGLYNHGGWFGEPENQLAVLERLRADGATNVGLVYNFHHGHDHLDRFAEFWPKIQRHVLAVNVNGMIAGGDKSGKKLLYVGEGDRELGLLRVIDASGWRGLVGVLNHRTDVDAEVGLRENLIGLERLVGKIHSVR